MIHASVLCPHCREAVTPVVALATSQLVCPWCDTSIGGVYWRYCAACEGDVTTGLTLKCPGCGGVTTNSYTCPSCGGRKSGPAELCVACVRRDAAGRLVATTSSSARCPSCGGPKTPPAHRCWRCYVAAGSHTGRRHRKDRGLEKIDKATLQRARNLYEQGLSVRAVAREILPDTGYANERSAANSLFGLFKARGWPLRDRVQATVAANVARRWRPQCAHIFQAGAKAGQQCERQATGDDGYCWHHRPENIAAGIARLRGEG